MVHANRLGIVARVALGLLVGLHAVGCAAGNLDERPGWARGFDQWKSSSAGQAGLMGSLIAEHNDAPQQLFSQYPEKDYLFVVGEGRATRGNPGDAKRAAQKNAQAELANMLWVAVASEMTLEAKSTLADGKSSSREELGESVQTFSASVLSDMSVAREWYGFEGTSEVAYVLMALNRRTSAANLANLVDQDVAAARTLVAGIDESLDRGELAGLPLQVADLHMRTERLRAGLLALGVLDGGKTAARVQDDVASLGAESTRLRLDVLENVMPSEMPTAPFVRGRDEAVLAMRLQLPLGGRMQALPSCALRVQAPGRKEQRLRTDVDGRLTLPLVLAADTREGEYEVEVTYDLCHDHDASAAGCTPCALEGQLAWKVPYRVVHDEARFAEAFAAAEDAFELGKWKAAREGYTSAGKLVFDVPSESSRCEMRLREVGLEVQLEDAGDLLAEERFADALDLYASAFATLGDVPDGERRAPSVRDAGVSAAVAYGSAQAQTGSVKTRERCLERLEQADRVWDAPDVREGISSIKLLLPCLTCGTSGRCPTCKGSSRPGMVLADCPTCEGKGNLPADCAACAGGFVPCTQCANAGLKACPDCKGEWSKTHLKCNGAGCKKCEDGKILCTRCARCKVHKTWADACVTPGKIKAECKTCGGDGKLRCKSCQVGPYRFAGVEWKGYVLETCPRCAGERKELVACPAGCDDGVCPTCEGLAHRM